MNLNHKLLLTIFLLVKCSFSQSTCSGKSTDQDGFLGQTSSFTAISFSPYSYLVQQSPLVSVYTDLYAQVWFRVENQAAISTQASLFKCGAALQLVNQGGGIKLQAQVVVNTKTFNISTGSLSFQNGASTSSEYDLSAWNHAAIYIDSAQVLYLSLNQKVMGSQSVGQGGIAYTSTCQLGGQNFQGSLRHFLIASSHSNFIADYLARYANQVPSYLDPSIVSYNSLQTKSEIQATFQAMGTTSMTTINEPEKVCYCLGDSDEPTSNYLQIGGASMSLQQPVIFPFGARYNVRLKFTINIRSSGANQDLLQHFGIWALRLTSNSLQVRVAGKLDAITFPLAGPLGQNLFLNTWMTYTFIYSPTQVSLIISDLSSNNPVTITVPFSSPINMTALGFSPEDSGNFVFPPTPNLDALLSEIAYEVNGQEIFDFKLGLSHLQSPSAYYRVQEKVPRKIYEGSFISNGYQLLGSSLSFVQANGPCNPESEDFRFDGVACKNKRAYLQLNPPGSTRNQWLEGYLKSANSMFTFEAWLKFQGMQANQVNSSLLSIYSSMQALQTQVYLNGPLGSTKYSIVCDPNNKVPRSPGFLDPATISNALPLNQWVHFSCVSNGSAQTMTSYLFDPSKSQTTSANTSNSYIVTLMSSVPRTIIGNNLAANQPFQGFIREMRFWSYPRRLDEISSLRYQSIPDSSSLSAQLASYAILVGGSGLETINLDIAPSTGLGFLYINSTSSSEIVDSSAFQWTYDSQLRVCPPDTVLNPTTLCCTDSSFYITVSTSYSTGSDGQNYLVLSVAVNENFTSPSSVNQGLYKHAWSILSVMNASSSTQQMTTIQKYLSSQPYDSVNRAIKIPTEYLDTSSAYLMQVTVTGLTRIYAATQYANVSVSANCPTISIVTNGQNPLVISALMNPSALVFTANAVNQCYGQTITDLGIQWELPEQLGTYSLSSDSKTLTFTSISQSVLSTQKISVTYRYQVKGKVATSVSDSKSVLFTTDPFNLVMRSSPGILNPLTDNVAFDSIGSTLNVNYPAGMQLEYSIDCPWHLFNSDSKMQENCQVDEDGRFSLSPSETDYVNHMTYTFTYRAYSDILGFSKSKQLSVLFAVQSAYYCPGIFLPLSTRYSYSNQDDDHYVITPTIYLNCVQASGSTTSYSIVSSKWSVQNQTDASKVLDIYENVAVVNKAKIASKLKPLFSFNITFTATISGGTTLSATTLFLITKTPLVLNVQCNFANCRIPFNETMIIDASSSYDPDQLGARLQFSWQVTTDVARSGSTLKLDPFERLANGYLIGSALQKIVITAWNPSYPSFTSTTTVDVLLDPEISTRSPQILPNVCQVSLSALGGYYFSMLNLTEINVGGTVNQRCLSSTAIAYSQSIVSYPAPLDPQGQGGYRLVEGLAMDWLVTTDQIKALAPGTSATLNFIFLANFSSSQYDYSLVSVKVSKSPVPIQVFFVGVESPANLVKVGQEESYTIDASASQDLDYPESKSSFSYIWDCPGGVICTGSGPQLVFTKAMRQQAGLNSVGNKFQVGVQIYSFQKSSSQVNLNIQVVQQNISSCISLSIANSVQNVLRVSRDMEYPLTIKLLTNTLCANVSFNQAIWSSQTPQFWVQNQLSMMDILIMDPSDLPARGATITVQVLNTVYVSQANGNTQPLNGLSTYQFSLERASSLLVPILKVSPSYPIVVPSTISLDASDSFDPDGTSSLKCQWTCPPQLASQAGCKQQSCIIQITPSTLSFVNITSLSQTVDFEVLISSSDLTRQASRSVQVTLLSPLLRNKLPLCKIENFNQRQMFDVEKQMVFQPDCSQGNTGMSFLSPLNYTWSLTPSVSGINLNSFFLDIPAFYLLQSLQKPSRILTVKLTVQSSFASYTTEKDYELPRIVSGYPSSSLASLTVMPATVINLLTAATFKVNYLPLSNNMFYRLRVVLTDGNSTVLYRKFTCTSVTVSLPRRSKQVYLDVVQDQRRDSNNFTVYTIEAQTLYITDQSYMTMSQFNYQAVPRITQMLDPDFDFLDTSEVLKESLQLTLTHGIISLGTPANQKIYNPQFFPQFEAFFEGTLSTAKQTVIANAPSPQLFQLMSQEFAILAAMFMQSCNSSPDDAESYLQMAEDTMLSANGMAILSDSSVDRMSGRQFIRNLNLLINWPCLRNDRKKSYAEISNMLFRKTLVNGTTEIYVNPLNSSDIYTIYSLSTLDKKATKLIQLPATSSQSGVVSILSSSLSSQVQYLLIRFSNTATTTSSALKVGSTYLASVAVGDVQAWDVSFKSPDLTSTGFAVNVTLRIQSAILSSIRNNTVDPSQVLQCISKQSSEGSFNLTQKSDIAIDASQVLASGQVTCTATHLTQFAVAYTVPFPYMPNVQINNSSMQLTALSQSIFETFPLLKYLLPACLLLFILLLAIFGLVISRLEEKRSIPRLFNKETLQENLLKYSYCRLLGCIFLQFNPILNFIFKQNFYLTRPVRLMMIVLYLLVMSALATIYFMVMEPQDIVKVDQIFWYGIAIQIVILLLRPRVQDYYFQLFYPKSLTNWKKSQSGDESARKRLYSGRPRSAQGILSKQREFQPQEEELDKRDKMKKKNDIDDVQVEEDSMYQSAAKRPRSGMPGLRDSMRLEHSSSRLIDNMSSSKVDESHDQMFFASQKLGVNNQINQNEPQNEQDGTYERAGFMDRFIKKHDKQASKGPKEIELSDLGATRHKTLEDGIQSANQNEKAPNQVEEELPDFSRDSVRDLLRDSYQTNEVYDVIFNQYPGFQAGAEPGDHSRNVPITINLKSRNLSEIDIEDTEPNTEKEGGEEEESKDSLDPNPVSKVSIISESQVEGSESNEYSESSHQAEIKIQPAVLEKPTPGSPVSPDGNNDEQSTDSLETVYKNYRVLKELPTSVIKRLLGLTLQIVSIAALLLVHVYLMNPMTEAQFTNWVSCTVFAFAVMIFGVDLVLFVIVTIALKRSNGVLDKRKCCTMFNLLVYWPLGKWKYQELEIELAKLKDFDKEYLIAQYA